MSVDNDASVEKTEALKPAEIKDKNGDSENNPEEKENMELNTDDRGKKSADDRSSEQESSPSKNNNNAGEEDEVSEDINELRESYELKIEQLSREIERIKEEKTEEIDTLRREIRENKLITKIRDSAYRSGFVEPDDAVMYIRDRLETDSEEIIIDGKKIRNGEIDEYIDRSIKSLSESKPHLVRSTWKSGSDAASSDAQTGSYGRHKDFSNPADRRRYEEELRMLGLPLINPLK